MYIFITFYVFLAKTVYTMEVSNRNYFIYKQIYKISHKIVYFSHVIADDCLF